MRIHERIHGVPVAAAFTLLVAAGLALAFLGGHLSSARPTGTTSPCQPTRTVARSPTPTPDHLPAPPPGTPDLSGLEPTPIRIVDLAPGVPRRDEVEVLVSRPDCSREAYFVEPGKADQLEQRLPAGDRIVVVAPPQSLMGQHAPPPPPPQPTAVPPLRTVQFHHLWLADARTGWLAGAHCREQPPSTPDPNTNLPPPVLCQGLIEGSTDGGRSWHEQYRGDVRVGQIQFVGGQSGWAIGPKGEACPDPSCRNVLLRTTDGGAHWGEAYTTTLTGPSIAFTSPSDGWLVGQACGFDSHVDYCVGHLLATGDGGRTWRELALPKPVLSPVFAHPTTADGWIASNPDRSGTSDLLVTHDGGHTWRAVAEPKGNLGFSQLLFFRTPSEGWLLDAGQPAAGSQQKQVYRTGDGGATWTRLAASATWYASGSKDDGIPTGGYVGPIVFSTDREGWIASPRGSLLHSADGGKTWTSAPIDDSSFADVHFADPRNGWALSIEGPGLWTTADGGATWRVLSLPGAYR